MDFQKLTPEELRKHKGVSFPGITTVFICYDDKSRLFMTRRSSNARDEHGRWEGGAGGLKFGSTIIDNLTREIMEECGAHPLKIDFINYFDALRTMNGRLTHWVGLGFAVKVDAQEVHINEPEMIDDSGWFNIDNLPSPLHSQVGPFFEQNYERILAIISGNTS